MDPSANKKIRAAGFAGKHRFPDLLRKQVWREKIEAMPNADVFLRHADGRLEQVAFGESDGASDIAGVDAKKDLSGRTKSSAEDVLPWFVRSGLKMISEDRRYAPVGATVKVVCPEGKSKSVFCLPMSLNEDGEIDVRLLFTRIDGSTYPRRGCFIEVLVDAIHQRYLLIVEGQAPRRRSTIEEVSNLNVPFIINTILTSATFCS